MLVSAAIIADAYALSIATCHLKIANSLPLYFFFRSFAVFFYSFLLNCIFNFFVVIFSTMNFYIQHFQAQPKATQCTQYICMYVVDTRQTFIYIHANIYVEAIVRAIDYLCMHVVGVTVVSRSAQLSNKICHAVKLSSTLKPQRNK